MHDGADIGPRLVDFAVQIALAVGAPTARIDRLAGCDAELENVIGFHQRRRHRPRQQESIRIFG